MCCWAGVYIQFTIEVSSRYPGLDATTGDSAWRSPYDVHSRLRRLPRHLRQSTVGVAPETCSLLDDCVDVSAQQAMSRLPPLMSIFPRFHQPFCLEPLPFASTASPSVGFWWACLEYSEWSRFGSGRPFGFGFLVLQTSFPRLLKHLSSSEPELALGLCLQKIIQPDL